MKLMKNFQCGKKKPKQIQIKNSLLKFKMTHYLGVQFNLNQMKTYIDAVDAQKHVPTMI